MKLLVLTQREKLYENEVKEVSLPGRDGEFSVWDFHQAFLYRLRKGYVQFKESGEDLKDAPLRRILIRDGLARMKSNILTVLAET